ncbi:septum formation initiator family protein [Cellulomonas sp. WB94]|uniref:FtsB family cell division protein n=1 Tax=Cellulomonas sp. WB94 TaxID=2173174 RepID=UPI001F5B7F2C|nr:septum formation initiator family protein [Cellulomonas sp. WB94]
MPRAETVQVRIPRLFTVRVMVMGVVTLLAFVLVFPTLRSYLQQREELRQLAAEVAVARAGNDDLTNRLKRWDDPAFVVAQARERLAFVLPGETAYRVQDPGSVADVPAATSSAAAAAASGAALGAANTTEPWYQVIWGSVLVAGSTSNGDATSGENGPAPTDGSSTPAGEPTAP